MKINTTKQDRFRGALLGLAVGDAVGTTVEFAFRDSFPPVVDMVGGGPFELNAGEWTDDTSMALCLAVSLVESNGFDAQDQMARYLQWETNGYMSSNGYCFDIGPTTSAAIARFEMTGQVYDTKEYAENSTRGASNGCIMRLAPIPMWFFDDKVAAILYSKLSSTTTHGHFECVESAALLGKVIHDALSGADRREIEHFDTPTQFAATRVRDIAVGTYKRKDRAAISSSLMAVGALEAALWCFHNTYDFKSAILMAANLGDDADTVAAICGQIAGAFYGESGIPKEWVDRIVMRDEIRLLADGLLEHKQVGEIKQVAKTKEGHRYAYGLS